MDIETINFNLGGAVMSGAISPNKSRFSLVASIPFRLFPLEVTAENVALSKLEYIVDSDAQTVLIMRKRN